MRCILEGYNFEFKKPVFGHTGLPHVYYSCHSLEYSLRKTVALAIFLEWSLKLHLEYSWELNVYTKEYFTLKVK